MTLRWIERRSRARAGKARRWPFLSMIVVLTAGLAWEFIYLHTTLTMECEGYYAHWTDGHTTGQSLLQAVALFVAVLAIWWLADLLRPKPYRTAILARVFEGWIIAAMALVTLFNWGVLYPESRVFPIANHAMAYFDDWAGGSYFMLYEQPPLGSEDWVVREPNEVSSMEWTPFRLTNGRLACTMEREFWERYDGEFWVWPFAITEAVD
tara:strand:- start:1351 stop:1977 length:627 start_codon:yes stop_codon:yes gene_type:complete